MTDAGAAPRAEGPGPRAVEAARDWTPTRAEGAGPFASRLRWRMPDGGEATWESRLARKRGTITVRADGATRTVAAPRAVARRLGMQAFDRPPTGPAR